MTSTTSRGTILRAPDTRPGIVFLEGKQYAFTLEGAWRSATAPAPDQVVAIELDGAGNIAALTLVDAAQLQRERVERLSGAAQLHGKQAAALARQGAGAIAARLGTFTLASTAGLWVAWFALPVVSAGTLGISSSFTFWDLLALDLDSPLQSGAHGLFSFLGLIAIAAPLAQPLLRQSWARYLPALPALFIGLALLRIGWQVLGIYGKIREAEEQMGPLAGLARGASQSMLDLISVRYGAVLLLGAALGLAVRGWRIAAQRSEQNLVEPGVPVG